ncbi:MAG: DUF2007 domain-containing protein [Maribacter sp.]|nr:DUF2007 domain-containing protein [Maribacter sp.]
MHSNYKKIYGGDSLVAQRLVSQLHAVGIEAVVKDEAESARLTGFASSMLGEVDVYVNNDEVNTALKVVQEVLGA